MDIARTHGSLDDTQNHKQTLTLPGMLGWQGIETANLPY